ncbi:hypothetical protein CRYUN_Cryun09bG0112900 [Craigia yunnanensis]
MCPSLTRGIRECLGVVLHEHEKAGLVGPKTLLTLSPPGESFASIEVVVKSEEGGGDRVEEEKSTAEMEETCLLTIINV